MFSSLSLFGTLRPIFNLCSKYTDILYTLEFTVDIERCHGEMGLANIGP